MAIIGKLTLFFYSFSPSTSGQTEVVNHSLVHLLCIFYTHNKQWVTNLHVLQHNHNQAMNRSTGYSPIEAYYGCHLFAPYEVPVTIQATASRT